MRLSRVWCVEMFDMSLMCVWVAFGGCVSGVCMIFVWCVSGGSLVDVHCLMCVWCV